MLSKFKASPTWSTPVKDEKTNSILCNICGGSNFKPSLNCNGFRYVKCTSCGLVQINPQPEAQAVHQRYSGDSYLEYELTNENNFFNLGKQTLFDANISEIEKRAGPNRRVLEIGSATGALLEFLSWRGWKTQGVEISKEQAEYARKKRSLNISDLPLEENKFSSDYFSLVIASHLIEHLNDPTSFVREVYRVLSPGGTFLVTTPNIGGFQAHIFGDKWRCAIFDHLYLFSTDTLKRLLTNEGFKIEKIVTWGGLAKGYAPRIIKKIFDVSAKLFGFGDVMLISVVKQ